MILEVKFNYETNIERMYLKMIIQEIKDTIKAEFAVKGKVVVKEINAKT